MTFRTGTRSLNTNDGEVEIIDATGASIGVIDLTTGDLTLNNNATGYGN
jgi:hypothetical protein